MNHYSYVDNSPVGWVDPFGLLARSGGRIVWVPGNTLVSTTHPESGRHGTQQTGSVIADDGTPITAYKNVGPDSGFDTNCHGTTFAHGEYWINNTEVDDLWEHDGYHRLDNPQDARPGDVVLYRDPEKGVVHSVRLVCDASGGMVARGLGGMQETLRDLPVAPGRGGAYFDPAAQPEFYRKD
jgi:hypothetical protein